MAVTAELADGRRLEFPDGTDPGVVQATVKRVLASAPAAAKPAAEPSLLQRAGDALQGAAEAGLTVASGATGGLLGRLGGTIGGIAASVASGKYGTQEGAQMAAQTAEEGAQRFTYQPKTTAGQEALATIGRLFDESKLGGIGPAESIALTGVVPAVRPAIRQAAAPVENTALAVAERVQRPPERQMAGGGSASTFDDALRRERAAQLPVPINLTKGQAERTLAQQQFERETAKDPTRGEAIRQRYAEQNDQILKNFDAWVDQTGAEAGSLRATGEAVTQPMVNKANRMKSEIRAAYDKAEKEGAMAEAVDVRPLRRWLEDHAPDDVAVISSVQKRLDKLSGGLDQMPIGALERVRRGAGDLGGTDATNAKFASDIKGVIDQITEGKGGEAYKQARALRYRYGQEFERQGVIKKLLANKPGTTDRAVALEDVFEHSINKGSLDDVRNVRKTLQTEGPSGQQGWRELQGAGIKYLKNEITKGVETDAKGNPVVNTRRLKDIVDGWDADGKLEFVYGKKGAQQIRDVVGIAQDVFTSVKGAENHSNTAAVLFAILDSTVSLATGLPVPAASAVNYGVKKLKDRSVQKRVDEALKDPNAR